MKITVLFNPKKITILYTLYPFWVSKLRREFMFTTDVDWALRKDKNTKLLMVGWFTGQDKDGKHRQLLTLLRNKYEVISYLDDGDGTESHYLDLLGFFHVYYKKQIFRDRENYKRQFYGNRIFTEFYRTKFGINEEPLPLQLPKLKNEEGLEKIKVSWNLAFGQYPISKYRQHVARYLFSLTNKEFMGIAFSKNPIFGKLPSPSVLKCQARFGFKGYRESIGYQRKLFLETLKGDPNFLLGHISLKEYNQEVKQVAAILSPYGWGEVCFRDFEAILNGAVLVKPGMDHVETWPNVYHANKTYLPVDWDGSDIGSKVEYLLGQRTLMDELRIAAWETLRSSYFEVDQKIEEILQDFR